MSRTTLATPAQFELVVKKSRFRAHAAPIDAAATAQAFIAATRADDASHNCWAWRLGDSYRSSDDGEPAGTAGRPILAAIDGAGCDGVAVLVARWFGGIKLGAGGLVRAYGGSAAQCLRLAPKIVCVERTRATLACPFEHANVVHQQLSRFQAVKCDEHFAADGLHLTIDLPRHQLPALQTALGDATRGRIQLLECTQ